MLFERKTTLFRGVFAQKLSYRHPVSRDRSGITTEKEDMKCLSGIIHADTREVEGKEGRDDEKSGSPLRKRTELGAGTECIDRH